MHGPLGISLVRTVSRLKALFKEVAKRPAELFAKVEEVVEDKVWCRWQVGPESSEQAQVVVPQCGNARSVHRCCALVSDPQVEGLDEVEDGGRDHKQHVVSGDPLLLVHLGHVHVNAVLVCHWQGCQRVQDLCGTRASDPRVGIAKLEVRGLAQGTCDGCLVLHLCEFSDCLHVVQVTHSKTMDTRGKLLLEDVDAVVEEAGPGMEWSVHNLFHGQAPKWFATRSKCSWRHHFPAVPWPSGPRVTLVRTREGTPKTDGVIGTCAAWLADVSDNSQECHPVSDKQRTE